MVIEYPNPLKGKFHFFGFRDPHLFSTLQACYMAENNLINKPFLDRELEEAKLGIIQGIDKPISPGARGESAYYLMRSKLTQKRRPAK